MFTCHTLYTFLTLRMCQASGSSPLENIVQLSSGEFGSCVAMNQLIIDLLAAVIIFEHSFYIYDKRRHLRDQQESAPSYIVALELYMASPHAAAVRETVRAAVQAYEEEAKKAPAHTYKGNLPAWMAKLLFERSEEKKRQKSMAKAGLIKTVLEITLEHRLRMFHYHIVAAIRSSAHVQQDLNGRQCNTTSMMFRVGVELRCFGSECGFLEWSVEVVEEVSMLYDHALFLV
jgi:hypothetical protein